VIIIWIGAPHKKVISFVRFSVYLSSFLGIFFAGQNAGVLIMLIAGNYLDRFNRKWTIAVSISLVVISNIVVPLLSHKSFLFGIFGRLLVGIADMLLITSSSSMIMRWFPPKERPFAIGLITGGRQIGRF
jgi:MFS family permease